VREDENGTRNKMRIDTYPMGFYPSVLRERCETGGNMDERDVRISYKYMGLEISIDRSSTDDVNSIAGDFEKLARALMDVVDRLEEEKAS